MRVGFSGSFGFKLMELSKVVGCHLPKGPIIGDVEYVEVEYLCFHESLAKAWH